MKERNQVSDFNIVYISYDEPNAEENYRDLLNKFPKAKRVHGMKGFDRAHRKAADLVTTEHLFIIDGDNRVTRDFSDLKLQNLNPNYVYSWAAKNVINGLIYGNGGIKLWPKKLLLNLDCHDSGKNTDWCFQLPYFQMNDYYSYSYCNASPFQAFRTGFREGVKLCLNSNGERQLVGKNGMGVIAPVNLRRLITWLTVGIDVVNGIYAIFGARLGVFKTLTEKDFNPHLISNYEWLKQYWEEELFYVGDGYYQEHYDNMVGYLRQATGLPICNMDAEQSLCMKKTMFNPKRSGLMHPWLDESQRGMQNTSSEKSL